MAVKFPNGVDLTNTQLLNALAQILASDPTGIEGLFYYNSASHVLKIYNGSAWVTVGSTDAATLQGDTLAQVLARANHTGTQAASTISDLATVVQAYSLSLFAAPTADLAIGSHKITGVSTPTAGTDAANKSYVDATAQGLEIHIPVRAASTANVSVSSAPATLDGVTLAATDRVLLKDQTTGAENGIYVFSAAASALTRATDANSASNLASGSFVFVTEGTANDNAGYVLTTNNPITVGTTALTWAQFSGAGTYAAGTGLTLTGSTFAQDTANGYGVRKYATAIGDGSTTAIVVTHNLNTRNLTWSCASAATPWSEAIPDFERTTVNTATLRFATAPTTGQYIVTIIG